MKKIAVLGSTGSVGKSALEVVSRHRDQFAIVGLTAGNNVSLLKEQCDAFPQARFAVGNVQASRRILDLEPSLETRHLGYGSRAIIDLIDETAPDLVVNCLVGFVGLRPSLHALESGIDVALANKEAVVTGGEFLIRSADAGGARIIPIDSEHVAISQCLVGRRIEDVRTIHMTASGGALRDRDPEDLQSVELEDVLNHPTWDMGNKITVDSATMLNKGMEVIEAHWLFDMPYEKIDIVIHPQSIVHSLIEFRDGSIIAQMSIPDMKLPILYALSYPECLPTDLVSSDLTEFPPLSFSPVDYDRYPCLELTLEAGRMGGNMPTVLNAANEEAVKAFLAQKVAFFQIHDIIKDALDVTPHREIESIDEIIETDRSTRIHINKTFGL